MIYVSDIIYLTNFSDNKKEWPIYITIEIIKSTMCNRSYSIALLLLALLPVPPKLNGNNSWRVGESYIENYDTIH
jgi:hypothetical protein